MSAICALSNIYRLWFAFFVQADHRRKPYNPKAQGCCCGGQQHWKESNAD